jgi:hypothetical protein
LAEGFVMPRYALASPGGEDTRVESHFSQLRANPAGWLGGVAVNRLEPDLLRALGGRRPPFQVEPCSEAGHCSALRWWLYPTAGLALLSPATLIMAAPTAAALLLADKPGRFRRHWAAPMLPTIWLAVALGLARLAKVRWLCLAGAVAMALASLVMYRLDGSLPLGSQYEAGDVVQTPVGQDLRRLGAMIPEEASALASKRGLAHLANRAELYAFPPKDYGPGLWPPPRRPAFALLDLTNADTVRELATPTGALRGDPPYREVERTETAILLRSEGP